MPVPVVDGAAQDCWNKARDVIKDGVVLTPQTYSDGKVVVKNNLSKMKDNLAVHVRSHTDKRAYGLDNGVAMGDICKSADEHPDGRWTTKQSFWLNSGYLEKILGTKKM